MKPVTDPFATRRRRRHGRGFTALELLAAVTIIGILASLVVPSYAAYLSRSRVLDAAMRLGDHRAKMEQYFLDRRTFVDGGGNCGVAVAPATPDGAFDIACVATASTYRVTATGRAAGMAGFAYATDETGARITVAVPGGWIRSPDCWTVRPDGSCM